MSLAEEDRTLSATSSSSDTLDHLYNLLRNALSLPSQVEDTSPIIGPSDSESDKEGVMQNDGVFDFKRTSEYHTGGQYHEKSRADGTSHVVHTAFVKKRFVVTFYGDDGAVVGRGLEQECGPNIRFYVPLPYKQQGSTDTAVIDSGLKQSDDLKGEHGLGEAQGSITATNMDARLKCSAEMVMADVLDTGLDLEQDELQIERQLNELMTDQDELMAPLPEEDEEMFSFGMMDASIEGTDIFKEFDFGEGM